MSRNAYVSEDFLVSENEAFRCTVYWKEGKACNDALPPKEDGAVRFAAISDTHNKVAQFGAGAHVNLSHLKLPDSVDCLVHAGDFTGTGTNAQTEAFGDFLCEFAKPSFVIAGNHDVTFDEPYYEDRGRQRFHGRNAQEGDPRKLLPESCTYLEDSATVHEGIRLYGSPWQPEFCDWAFNLQRGAQIREKWAMIPDEVEVLMTHGPPHGRLGGICSNGFDAGCEELRTRIEQVKPLIHICGHIHEDYGVFLHKGVIIVNASSVNLSYMATNPPIVFDIQKKQ